MRITRLKLENFIGIKHGLDRDVVEITCPKGDNRIVMLLGGNGSGKSTIMEQLNPFKEGVSERKDLILEGKVGRKEVDIETENGDKYEIIHTYTKSAQSFIKKNGVELNENGGVRTFEEILTKELGITKDYSRIGNIGSNTRSFVDFVRAERKNYIGKFLNIEEMMEKYAVVNNKLKLLKKDISTVGSELGRFKNKEEIETEIKQTEEFLVEIETELKKLYEEQGAVTANLTRANTDLDGTSESLLESRITEKQNDIETNKEIKESLKDFITDIDNPEVGRDVIQDEISTIQTEISVNASEVQNKTLLQNDYKNKVAALKVEIQSFGNPEDLEKIKKDIAEVTEKIEKIKNKIRSNPYGQIVNGMIKEHSDVARNIEKFRNFTNFIEKYFVELSRNSFMRTKTNIKLFFDEDFDIEIESQAKEIKKVLQSQNTILEKTQKERGIKEGHVCQLKNLEKRPVECNIDSCPFIKDAYEHRNVVSEITKIDDDICALKNDIESLNIKLENLKELQTLYVNFQNALKNVDIRNNPIYALLVKEKSLIEWVEGSISDFKVAHESITENIESAIIDFSEYSSLRAKLVSFESAKLAIEDKDSTVREKYLSDINENNEKIELLNKEISELRKVGSEKTDLLNKKYKELDVYNSFIQACSKLNSAVTMLSTISSEYKRVSETNKLKIALELRKSEIEGRILELTKVQTEKKTSVDGLKAILVQVEKLGGKLATLNTDYAPVNAVAQALSPTTGIPLVLMKTYLEETETIANELLDIAFDGEFKIKFVTNDKEFAIQVLSKDNLKPDIKMASQGEIAITTISISLALIEQSIGMYNILCLDEIDGPLDIGNRTKFIDILDSQIKKLGIEQVFVISHNDAFDTAPMDLILLKGNSVNTENETFMENKNIIFNVYDS